MVKVGIVGGTGYTGVELLRHLQEMLRHSFDRRQNSLGVGAHQVQPGLEIAVRVRVHCASAFAANDHRRTVCGGAAAAAARCYVAVVVSVTITTTTVPACS